MEDIDAPPHTHTHRHIHTNTHMCVDTKHGDNALVFHKNFLHTLHEGIPITKQVMLPELLRPEFPDSSVRSSLTQKGEQQMGPLSARLRPHCCAIHTFLSTRTHSVFQHFPGTEVYADVLAHAAPTHINTCAHTHTLAIMSASLSLPVHNIW